MNFQHPDDRRNLIIFIVVSFLILNGFNHFVIMPRMEEYQAEAQMQGTSGAESATAKIVLREIAAGESEEIATNVFVGAKEMAPTQIAEAHRLARDFEDLQQAQDTSLPQNSVQPAQVQGNGGWEEHAIPLEEFIAQQRGTVSFESAPPLAGNANSQTALDRAIAGGLGGGLLAALSFGLLWVFGKLSKLFKKTSEFWPGPMSAKKSRFLLAFLAVFFMLSIGYVYGFEHLFLGGAILIFCGVLVFTFAHDLKLSWKETALIMIVWLMFILGSAKNNEIDEECSQSYDLRGSYCE
jgi:hypothetical protein